MSMHSQPIPFFIIEIRIYQCICPFCTFIDILLIELGYKVINTQVDV